MSENPLSQVGGWLTGNVRYWLAKLNDLARDFTNANVSEEEALQSGLPGHRNGPADAYRHLLWSAELTRRRGPVAGMAAAEAHEATDAIGYGSGSRDRDIPAGNTPAAREMDRHNNRLGAAIGLGAQSYDEVVAGARAAMEGSDRSGQGADGGPRWPSPETWDSRDAKRPTESWPATSWPTRRGHIDGYQERGPEFRYDHMDVPREELMRRWNAGPTTSSSTAEPGDQSASLLANSSLAPH